MNTKHTATIFERLRKGLFISANSPNEEIRNLYHILEDNFEEHYNYFATINYILENEEDYFYFSKNISKTDLQNKLEKVFKWIDILDFLKTYDSNFTVGSRFTPAEISQQLNINIDLKSKLESNSLKKIFDKENNDLQCIIKIIKYLKDNNFVALENPRSETYKVLSSFRYLEDIIKMINIPETTENEIPE